jgi:hypothetical protein
MYDDHIKDIRSLEQFRAQRKIITLEEQLETWDYHSVEDYIFKSEFVVYDHGIYIEKKNDLYLTIIYKDVLIEWEQQGLEELEEHLWDEVKVEIYELEEDEILNDLHERARYYIESVGETCSLDEISKDLPKSVKKRIDYLLNQFEEMQ